MFSDIDNQAKPISLRSLFQKEIASLNIILFEEAKTDPNGKYLSFENFSTMTIYPSLKVIGILKHGVPVGMIQIIVDGEDVLIQKFYLIPALRGTVSLRICRDFFFKELGRNGIKRLRFDWAKNDVTNRLEKLWVRLLKNHNHVIFPDRTCRVDL